MSKGKAALSTCKPLFKGGLINTTLFSVFSVARGFLVAPSSILDDARLDYTALREYDALSARLSF